MYKEYRKDDLIIGWEDSKCIHSGICARGLPGVFKPKQKPWIQVDNETKEKIKAQIALCPSGALTVKEE